MKKIKIYAQGLEQKALDQFNEAMQQECNVQGALMPDTHTGYTLPIGAVIKSKGRIFPSYVGYDIGCGVCALRTSVKVFSKKDLERLKSKILKRIPLGFNRFDKPQVIETYTGRSEIAQDVFKNLAQYQIGTLGGGNHFIEVGTDSKGYLNIIIHSGSRGIGHKIASYYMKEAQIRQNTENSQNLTNNIKYLKAFEEKNSDWKKSLEKSGKSFERYEDAKVKYINKQQEKENSGTIEGHYSFDIESDIGKDYIFDLNEALRFALDNRKKMVQEVVKAMKEVFDFVETDLFINRNHNHAEVKDGYVIHRKGATHAEKGMMGVVPGNMKDGSFIVQGKGNSDSMSSSSHGAGRVSSRAEARKKFTYSGMRKEMENIVNNHNKGTVDESSGAYKNIFEVMRLQKDLVLVVDRIIPVLNIKG